MSKKQILILVVGLSLIAVIGIMGAAGVFAGTPTQPPAQNQPAGLVTFTEGDALSVTVVGNHATVNVSHGAITPGGVPGIFTDFGPIFADPTLNFNLVEEGFTVHASRNEGITWAQLPFTFPIPPQYDGVAGFHLTMGTSWFRITRHTGETHTFIITANRESTTDYMARLVRFAEGDARSVEINGSDINVVVRHGATTPATGIPAIFIDFGAIFTDTALDFATTQAGFAVHASRDGQTWNQLPFTFPIPPQYDGVAGFHLTMGTSTFRIVRHTGQTYTFTVTAVVESV